LDGRKIFRADCSETVWRHRENAVKVQIESLVPDLSKITKTERIEEMVLLHEWLSDLKALQAQTHSF
jgi:hypothetical protein